MRFGAAHVGGAVVALIVSSLCLRADAFLPCATPTRFLSRAPASLDSAARQGWRAGNVVSVIMQDMLVCSAVTVDTKKIQESAEQELKKPLRIMIAGATGRVGRQVVQEVLKRIPTSTVVAVVRNTTAADEAFDKVLNDYRGRIVVKQCNLGSTSELKDCMVDVDRVIWCATGFSGPRGKTSPWSLLGRVIRFKLGQLTGRALDVRGPAKAARLLKKNLSSEEEQGVLPKVVLLSSAAVTRPSWSEDKRARFQEAANIPIVKLNPLGILGTKAKGEEKLRRAGVPYSIVRACGINATHPSGDLVVSSGDTAIGRINPSDVATVLATVLTVPESTGKTFEVYANEQKAGGAWTTRGSKSQLVDGLSAVKQDKDRTENE